MLTYIQNSVIQIRNGQKMGFQPFLINNSIYKGDSAMTDTPIIFSRKKSKIKIGDKFGKLTVIENCGIIKGRTHFKCKCECGNISIVWNCHLSDGHTKSCGCFAINMHGMSRTPTYKAWVGMIQRCTNLKSKSYKNYGGRGITVCKRWLDFRNFYKDMKERPEGLTLERTDNDKGYFKENCEWVTRTKQIRNRRLNKTNKTGVAGIFWNEKTQQYQVAICVNYKQHNMGYFKSFKLAKIARFNAEQKYWNTVEE